MSRIDLRTITDRWCQAVRELYEVQQNSATDRRATFAQNALESAITYGAIKDDVPNKFDKQQFLYQSQSSNTSQNSGSPRTHYNSEKRTTSQSPIALFSDIIQTAQPPPVEQVAVKPKLIYPPTAEITPESRRKVEEERAVLEAMAQSASLPVSPLLAPTSYLGWIDFPFQFRDPETQAFQYGTTVPLMGGMQMDTDHVSDQSGQPIQMEDFPSLDEIINSMEGGGMDTSGFGFLDDLNLFGVPLG